MNLLFKESRSVVQLDRMHSALLRARVVRLRASPGVTDNPLQKQATHLEYLLKFRIWRTFIVANTSEFTHPFKMKKCAKLIFF